MLDHKNNRQIGNLLAGLTDELENCIAPSEVALCIPPKCYTSEDHYAHEIDLIFRRKWIGIGHAGRFKEAGDYEAMEIGGVPIIVLRDKQGALRAYANSCRHRGARLLEGEGRCSGIRCPFHSWAYKLDGTLAGVPRIEEIPDFDRSQYGLIEFRAAEIAGLGFVCLDNNAPSAETQLGDFTELHAPWPMDTLVPMRRRSFEINCNWKAFIDVFNEYYHLPFVHPNTVDSLYNPPNPRDEVTGEYAS
ncbi:MAG: aromatic ring-hydroxylating oxygenase subunit alpha, partial [Candidatus Puniceispirillales bacterium]